MHLELKFDSHITKFCLKISKDLIVIWSNQAYF